MIQNRMMITIWTLAVLLFSACTENPSDTDPQKPPVEISLSEQNLLRAMELTDKAATAHFEGSGMAMARYYNPFTGTKSEEIGSVWMYSAAIEAVNAILHGLQVQMEHGNTDLYNKHFERYKTLLAQLYDNVDYYQGTFELVSYTQTKEWSIYGVNRGNSKGTARVDGVENVYDDQMWLIRELLESYKVTGEAAYLEKAEYLTEYVLDGWDSTRNSDGTERGGIPWGPGYVTKHACSNGPMVSPLVWLAEIYQGKNDEVAYRFIDEEDKETRMSLQVKKSDYYADFAKKLYDWQKDNLLRSDGVYDDMRGGCSPGSPQTETIDGTEYRRGGNCQDRVGPAISYNSGTMLSGAADLYRLTGDAKYLEEAQDLSDDSFQFFAKLDQTQEGFYSYDITGFNNWFNGVLMRGYVDVHPSYAPVSDYIGTFQENLDYGYENHLYDGFLPTNLLVGWSPTPANNRTEGMFNFAFAAEYAVLSRYELSK